MFSRSIVRSLVLVAGGLALQNCVVVQRPIPAGYGYGYGYGAPVVVQPAVGVGAGAGTPGVPIGPTRTAWGTPTVYVPHPVTGQPSTALQAGYAICDQGGPCMSNDPVARLRNGWKGGECVCTPPKNR